MALVNCPECGHKVSDKAQTCPSCGLGLAELPPNSDRGNQADLRQPQTSLRLELTEIDLEWERERQKYLVNRGPLGGGRQAPTKRMASRCMILMPILAVGIGILAAVATPDPVVGFCRGGFWAVVLLVVGFFSGRWLYRKAEAYDRAEAEHLRRREAARAKYEICLSKQASD